MSEWKKLKLEKLLNQYREEVTVDSKAIYKLVTVSNLGEIRLRNEVRGIEIKAQKGFIIKKDTFIYSRLSVHNGAMGIVPESLNGAFVTNEMPVFEINKNLIYPDFLIYLFKTNDFKNKISLLTKGMGRVRVKECQFLDIEINVPNLIEQEKILIRLNKKNNTYRSFINKNLKQIDIIKKLRQSILQDAIEGKMTVDWRKKNPNVEPASELLKKIKAEKEKLIAEKKIKKEKPLPEISKEEIPFQLPMGWEWCRLGDLATLITKGSSPKWQGVNYVQDESDGILFITSKNVGGYDLILDNLSFVEEKFNIIEPRSILKNGDLLTNIVGASIGRTAMYNLPNVANINQAVCLIRIETNQVIKKLILHVLNSTFIIDLMFEKQFSPGRANLSMSNISNFIIPISPLSEQKAIVEKVEILMQKLDKLEVEISQNQKTADMLMQAVLKEAFEK